MSSDSLCFSVLRLPPSSTLFPYTTPSDLQRIFLMSSLMLLLVWLIFFMVLIKLLPILGTISTTPEADRKSGSAGMPRPISYAVFCLKKKKSVDRLLPVAISAHHTRTAFHL